MTISTAISLPSPSPTAGEGCRRKSWRAPSSRSSPPRAPGKAPAWASPACTASRVNAAAGLRSAALQGRAPRSPCSCRAPLRPETGAARLGRFQQDVLFSLQHLADRRAFEHAPFPGGVIGEFLHRQLDAGTPAVEDESIGIASGELVSLHPALAGDHAVDLLQRRPESLLARRFDRGISSLLLAEPLRPENMGEGRVHGVG